MRSERPAVLFRQQRRWTIARFIREQLGDSEVQELNHAIRCDQHVGRLDIAMNHQMGVRMRDRSEYIEEKPDSIAQVEFAFLAIFIDGLTFNIFEDEIGSAIGRQARVNQFRDVRMAQLPEDAALTLKPLDPALARD